MKKTNPNKIPRTQADVDKAQKAGMLFGTEFAINIVLYVLKDKHGANDEDILKLRDEFMYQVDSISKGYLKYTDVKKVLQTDYDLTVQLV